MYLGVSTSYQRFTVLVFGLELRESVSEQLKQFKSQFIEMECEYHTMRDRLTQYCQVQCSACGNRS